MSSRELIAYGMIAALLLAAAVVILVIRLRARHRHRRDDRISVRIKE